jgi:hypothetical protein
LTSSDVLPRFKPGSAFQIAGVVSFLICVAGLAGWWCFENGCILYYGDAASHLNISRGLIDTRTPGYDQIGTVWLPVLHLICLPFVGNDWLWSTGLAGTLPVAACFVIAGTCFYLAARQAYDNALAATIALGCFALNPNLLYLAVIPMTEIVFLAALFVVLFAVLRFRVTQQHRWIGIALVASWFLSLTRYDGWFLIPFISFWFAYVALRRKRVVFCLFAAAASLAPIYWMAHNWWEKGNALDFYNGPYSAVAIQGHKPYPGYHDWIAAFHYYCKTGELCAGLPLILVGIVGTLFAWRYRALQPILFLSLTPLFYIWSMHSSGGTPIYIPPLWPHSYYNSRYGIAFVPLCAFAVGAIAVSLPRHWKKFSFIVVLLAVLPWLIHPSRQNWICWKESQVNSVDRRAWTEAAARFLQAYYRPGQGILSSAGDVTGIYCRAGIHLSETLNIGNGPMWFLATKRPDLFHPNLWSVNQAGDSLADALAHSPAAPYQMVVSIATGKDSLVLHILRRSAP